MIHSLVLWHGVRVGGLDTQSPIRFQRPGAPQVVDCFRVRYRQPILPEDELKAKTTLSVLWSWFALEDRSVVSKRLGARRT